MVSGFRANALQFLERLVPRRENGIEKKNAPGETALAGYDVPGTRMSTWVACVKGRRKGAPHEEYSSRARNLFVGRPQTVRRYGIVWLQRDRRENVKPIRARKETRKGNAGLARIAKERKKIPILIPYRWTREESLDKFEPFDMRCTRNCGPLLEVNSRNRARYVCKGNPGDRR